MYKSFILLFFAFAYSISIKAQSSAGIVIPPNDSVYSVADSMPRFPGGNNQFSLYIAKNIRYPLSCRLKGIQGRVFVQMIIEKDGSILNPIVIRSVDKDIDLEAIRVIKSSPKWEPALVAGVPVRMHYTIPISFYMAVTADDVRKIKNPGSN